jgi:protein SCO1/2
VGAAAKAYRVYYARATGTTAPSDPADYLMDHSAVVYLMGPDGAFVTHFSPGTTADEMAQALRQLLS